MKCFIQKLFKRKRNKATISSESKRKILSLPMDTVKFQNNSVKLIAHRGLSGIEAENSLAAFVAAGNRNYYGIETDVHKTKDGKYVVIHDSTTGRVAEKDVTIEKRTFAELRTLRLKDKDGTLRSDLTIPTLEEYISVCKRYGKEIVLELKYGLSNSDIEEIICDMTGIPVQQLSATEISRIIHMEEELHNTVIGQNDAVHVICGAIRRSRAGISSPKHPVGSFIFLGPTGVGKTQLAKALAKYLFGSEDALIRIDMSDFMEKHTASRLVGAPPGYVGYEDGGVLTEKVRRHPYSVVLLDEIEKAHPDIFNLLLQLLEEGELSDNLGHTVNFRNTVIIMTSNAGARQITNEGRVGFGTLEGVMPYEDIKAGALHELKKLLNPELINRLDDVIVFNALSKPEISRILDIQLADLSQRLSLKNLKIVVQNEAKDYLIEHGYNPSMGARPMKRLIRKEIEDPLAIAILENTDESKNIVNIDMQDGKIVISLEKTMPAGEKMKVAQVVGKSAAIK